MKKALKRSLSILLAITIIFSSAYVGLSEVDFGKIDFGSLFAVKAQAASASDLTFKLNGDGESYAVTDCDTSVSGELVIPSIYNGKPVTNIGSYAFYDCTSLPSITIPDSVTSIGEYAFEDCTSLTSVTIPESVTSIDYYAFCGCTSLTNVYVTDLAAWCGIDFYDIFSNPLFYADNLYINGNLVTEIVIPDSVTSISDCAFYKCTSLTSITIPDSVTSIGYDAFYGCTNLASVTIGNSVTNISSSAFRNCTSLTSITIPDSVTSIGDDAFYGCTSLTNVYITDLAAWCGIEFKDYSSNPLCYADKLYINGELPTDIVIPDGVTIIPAYAFSCENIVSVTIPNSVTSIGEHVFSSCTNLASVTIGNSVTSIGGYAFYGCTSLTSITIPDSVTSIGEHVFSSCTNLASVSIGNSVTSIGEYVFSSCTNLASVSIGNSVTSIGYHAFYDCTSLTSITIPDSVTSIGGYAFYGCTSLTNVYITDLVAWCGIDFGSSISNPLCYAKNLYINGELATDIVISDSVTSIGNYAFYRCDSLTSVTIPDSVTSIGYEAFYYCTSLTSITIPNTVTSIGDHAFYHCTGLTSITIPDSVTSIGDDAFRYCTRLTAINVNSGNLSYSSADGVLFNNNKTTLIQYPDAKTGETYKIPDSVKNFVSSAFYGANFKSIVLGKGYTNVISSLFSECSSPENVVIPTNITSISSNAFSDCYKIKNVFYGGTQDEWASMVIASGNTYLTSARIHYNVDVDDWENHWSKPVVTKEPTCTSNGTQTSTCPCGYEVTETLPSYGHSYPDEWQTQAPTCENRGYDYRVCTTCGYQYTTNWVYSLGHDYSTEWTVDVEPTCTQSGSKSHHCTRCDSTIDATTIFATGHMYGEWTVLVEPTCTEAGVAERVCEKCGYKQDSSSKQLVDASLYPESEHNYSDQLSQMYKFNYEEAKQIILTFSSSTYTEKNYDFIYIYDENGELYGKYSGSDLAGAVITLNGSFFTMKLTSDFSGNAYGFSFDSIEVIVKEPDIVQPLNHNFGDWVINVEPTETEKGTKTKTCSNCGYAVTEEVHPDSHVSGDDWIIDIAPTCSTEGSKHKKCLYCDEIVETQSIPTLAHSPSEWIIDKNATCTVNGSKHKECTVCGAVLETSEILFGDHSPSDWIIDKKPTCTASGSKHIECERCGDILETVSIKPNGHIESSWIVDKNALCTTSGTQHVECIKCTEILDVEIIAPTGHIVSDWIIDSNATCTKSGSKHTECEKCGAQIDTVIIKASGHITVVDEAVSSTCEATGLTEGSHCLICNEVLVAQAVVSATGHTPGDWITDENATVNATGSKHKECTTCGVKLETAVIPQLKPATPNLSSVANTPTGVKFVWGKVTGADSYVVYRRTYNASTKTWSGWTNIAKGVKTNSYLDTTAKSGTYYIYTVRAGNEAGYSGYNATGLKTYFLSTPTLASVTNSSAGVTVKWGKVTGATNYVVYRRAYNATTKKWSGWTNLGKTTATSFADKTAQSGNYYIYTVKALAGTYTSSYNTTGLKTYFLSAPALSKVASTTSGVKFTWGKVTGASGYIVYRRTYNASTKTWSGWTNLGKITSASFVDKSAKKGTYYVYTTKAYYGSYTSAYNTTGLKVKDVY